VLVVAVGHGTDSGPHATQNAASRLLRGENPEHPPAASLVLGKVLNALLLDHLDYDLAQLRGINRILEDGEAAFGPTFRPTLAKTTEKFRGASYRSIDPLVIRPSADLGQIAWNWMQEEGMYLPGVLGKVLGMVGRSQRAYSADFLSYLLFDGRYGKKLMALGQADAHAARDSLIAFFADD
jgi:NTE family protein